MKELLLQYAEYNVWANKLIIEPMLQLNEASVDTVIISSFPSIRATVHHIMGAESIWLQRLQLVRETLWLPDTFNGTFAEACADLLQYSTELIAFIKLHAADELMQVCSYNDRTGREHGMQVHHILHHVFNHSTYHRGQLVTMLRQVGVSKLPATDFVAFLKEAY